MIKPVNFIQWLELWKGITSMPICQRIYYRYVYTSVRSLVRLTLFFFSVFPFAVNIHKNQQAKAQAHKKANINPSKGRVRKMKRIGWWYREGMSKVYRLHCTSNSFIMEFLLFDAMHLCIHKMWSVFNRNVWKINKQMFSCSPFILLNSQAIKITNFKLTFLLFLPDSCSVLFCLVMSMFHVHVCVLVFVERLLCPFLCTLRAFLFIWMYFDCNVLFRRPTFPFFFFTFSSVFFCILFQSYNSIWWPHTGSKCLHLFLINIFAETLILANGKLSCRHDTSFYIFSLSFALSPRLLSLTETLSMSAPVGMSNISK